MDLPWFDSFVLTFLSLPLDNFLEKICSLYFGVVKVYKNGLTAEFNGTTKITIHACKSWYWSAFENSVSPLSIVIGAQHNESVSTMKKNLLDHKWPLIL